MRGSGFGGGGWGLVWLDYRAEEHSIKRAGFRVWCLVFGVWCLVFGVLGFGVWVLGFGFWI